MAASIGILGPLELRRDGEVLSPPAGHQRLLLVALAAAWGRPTLRDDLVDLLWPEDPPPSASRSLDAYLARLRGALARLDPALTIERQGDSFRLVTGPVTLDAELFAADLRTARRAMAAGDHLRVVYAADAGLAHWRSRALGDLADRDLLRGYAIHLDHERGSLVQLRARAMLHVGRPEDLVGDLGASVARSPLDEELRRLLMVAYTRVGRRTDALRTYDDYRALLAEEVGIEPSAELAQLHWRILDDDPLLLAGAGSPTDTRGDWALPPELTVPSPVSVGRDEALATLRRALGTVTDGRRGLVVLRGELGIGKSHVLAAAARAAHDGGAAVLAGTCDGDVQAPLGPFVRALRFFREQAGAEGDELVAPWWAELSRLLPEVPVEHPRPEPGLDPQTERARLFDAVVGWLGAVADQRPLVLVLEDLHWADATTLLLLKHVLAAPDLRRVLVVATVREPQRDTPELLAQVLGAARRDGALLDDVVLSALAVGDVVELVRALRPDLAADAPALEALAAALVERANGNPLFVLELLSEVPVRSRGERRSVEAIVAELGTPPSADHLVAGRIRHLDDTTRRVVTDAALIGDEVPFRLLVDVVGLDADVVLSALDEPIDLGFLVHLPDLTGGRFRFAHAVVRDALVERLRPAERIDGHRRITAAILRLEEPQRRAMVEELAHHASAASMVDGPLVALPHVLRAGRQALDRRAYGRAAWWFARGLALGEEGGVPEGPYPGRHAEDRPVPGLTRFDLLCALGSAERWAGDSTWRDHVLAAAELAQSAGDEDGVAEAALVGTRGFFRQTAVPDDEWIAALEAAVASSTDASPATRARLLASLASELVWCDPDERRFALSDEAVELARTTGSPALLSQVLLLRLVAVWAPDNAEERARVAQEAHDLATEAGDHALRCHVLRFGAAAAIEVGDRLRAEERLRACEQLTDEVAQPDLAWHLTLARAGWALWSGDLRRAQREADAAFEAGRRAGEPEAFTFTAAVHLEVARLRGTLGPLIEGALTQPSLPEDPAHGFLRHLAAAGHHDAARRELTAAVAGLDELRRGVHTLAALANLADVAARVGDPGAAEAVLPRLAPFADRIPQATVMQPVVHHHLGLLASVLGRGDEAEAHFAEAAAIHRAVEAPLHEAETLIAWGRHRGDEDRLAEGVRLAEERGAAGLLADG